MLITIYIIEGESSFEGYGFDLLKSGEERGEFSIYQLDITCIIMNVIEYSAVARTSVTCGSLSPS